MQAVKPQVVFHAAAHKHVLMEESRREAVKNNIFGTLNLALAADRHGVDRMVILSTVTAVNHQCDGAQTGVRTDHPVYGAAQQDPLHGGALRQCAGLEWQRHPLFKKQISMGGPVTVTRPDMKRYFMTIPEASQLVLQAGAIGESGSIFRAGYGHR